MACFDHHREEITVIQFTGYPLPVHQFVTVLWDFNPVPYCQPSSPTQMEYATSAVFGMACLAGTEINIQQYLPTLVLCNGVFMIELKSLKFENVEDVKEYDYPASMYL